MKGTIQILAITIAEGNLYYHSMGKCYNQCQIVLLLLFIYITDSSEII